MGETAVDLSGHIDTVSISADSKASQFQRFAIDLLLIKKK